MSRRRREITVQGAIRKPPGIGEVKAGERKGISGEEKRQEQPRQRDSGCFSGAKGKEREEREHVCQAEPHPREGKRKKSLYGAGRQGERGKKRQNRCLLST
jgi:hypothetical protein